MYLFSFTCFSAGRFSAISAQTGWNWFLLILLEAVSEWVTERVLREDKNKALDWQWQSSIRLKKAKWYFGEIKDNIHICISPNTKDITPIHHTCLTSSWFCLRYTADYLLIPLWFWVLRVQKTKTIGSIWIHGNFYHFYDSFWYMKNGIHHINLVNSGQWRQLCVWCGVCTNLISKSWRR